MAHVTSTVCDWKGCRASGATGSAAFLERKADGAGSMEDWHLVFDLCPKHMALILSKALDALGPGEAAGLLLDNGIETRKG